MTLDEIKAMNEDFISAAQAASVMKMDVGRLIGYARKGELPFPAVISGNRVKIPRKAFLAAYCPEEQEKEKPDSAAMIAAELHTMTMLLTAIAMKVDPNFAAFMERKEPAQ